MPRTKQKSAHYKEGTKERRDSSQTGRHREKEGAAKGQTTKLQRKTLT